MFQIISLRFETKATHRRLGSKNRGQICEISGGWGGRKFWVSISSSAQDLQYRSSFDGAMLQVGNESTKPKYRGDLNYKTLSSSGVTRAGDTRGGKWRCHPFIFFLKNLATFFAHRCHYHYRFLLHSLGCHPLEGVTPHLFLPLRPRFSTILCKFAHKIVFPSGVTPLEGVIRAPRPLVTPLLSSDISQPIDVPNTCPCVIVINVIDRPYGKDVRHERYWTAFQEIMLRARGQPHWAKDFQLSVDQMRAMHPGWTRFVEIRNRLDPDRMFTNDKLQRILGHWHRGQRSTF